MGLIETINSRASGYRVTSLNQLRRRTMPLNDLLSSLLAAYASGASGSSRD